MSIFQKAAIALARSPGAGRLMRATAAGSAGQPLCRRRHAGQAAATAARCASGTASAPRCSIWVNTSPTPPSSNRPSSRPSPPAARWRRRAWTCMCRLIPPPSATRTATRWAATMRGASRRRRGGRRRAARLGAGHGGRRHPRAYLRAASGTAGRRLAGGPDAGAAPAHPRDLEWAVRQRTSLRLVKGPSRCARWTIAAARIDAAYLEAAAIMLSPQARAGFPAGVRHP